MKNMQKCRLEEESEEIRKQKLKNLDQKLTHGSLGLEHFFREMAVMYDNVSALRERNKSRDLSEKLDILASIMAQVLMEGTVNRNYGWRCCKCSCGLATCSIRESSKQQKFKYF